jgi:hypothetical protein
MTIRVSYRHMGDEERTPACTATCKSGKPCIFPASENPEGWTLCEPHRRQRLLRGKRTYFRSSSMVMEGGAS